MKKRIMCLLVALVLTVAAGAFTPAVTASVLITESNVKTFTNHLDKGAGTVTGIEGTAKTTGDGNNCYSDYDVAMTSGTAYAYVGDTSIRDIKADSWGWAHFKFAVSEASNFVLEFKLQYQTASTRKTTSLFNMNNYSQISGTQQSPKPYSVDILIDFSGAQAYSFFNGIRKDEAVQVSLPDISYLRQLQFTNYSGASTHSYRVSGLLLEALPKDATYTDVLSYLNDSSAPIDYEKGTYFDGINIVSESDNISYGSMYIGEGSSSVTGDNTDGYLLEDTANGGFYRYFLFDNKNGSGSGMPSQTEDSVVRHSVQICPKSGNKTVSVGKYDAGEELVLLCFDENEYAVLDKNGGTVLGGYDNDTFYQLDFFFNNKDYQYSVYFEGKEIDSGTLSCVPVGYISYKNSAAGTGMTIKNIFTKIFPLKTSMKTVTGDIYGTAYIELEDLTVLENENGGYEISAAAVFSNVSKIYTDAKLIYALYRNGAPVSVGGADITDEIPVTNDELNLTYDEIDRKYPYGLLKTEGITINKGDTLTLRAWLISSEASEIHLIDSNEVSFSLMELI